MTEPIEAVRAMRERGIDNAEDLLQYAPPDRILAACAAWDERKGRTNVGPGLLAKMVRDGGPDPTPPPLDAPFVIRGLREKFDRYIAANPVGGVVEPHVEPQRRRWPDDEPCDGNLITVEIDTPTATDLTEDSSAPGWHHIVCDVCQFPASYKVRTR